MVKNCIDGFHSTIFCYGQTGSGKTYSMDGLKYKKTNKGVFLPITEEDGISNGNNMGLVQRSIGQLVQQITPIKKFRTVSLNVSFL